MKGIYLTYATTSDGQRKLIPRLEEHVILPELGPTDVMIHVKACALNRMDIQTLLELNPDVDQFPVGYEISGVITKVGTAVSLYVINDEVCGILSLDTECPGCAEYCVVPEYCLVKKPRDLTHVDVVSILSPAVRAYTILFYQARLDSASILLLFSALSPDGLAVISLCELLQIKVIAVTNSAEEAEKLSLLHPTLYKIVNTVTIKDLIEVCRQETGGMGVSCVVDQGVSPGYSITDFNITSMSVKNQVEQSLKRYEYETTPTTIHNLPTKQEIINLLASRGHWITTQPDLQLEPPETKLLFLKGNSLHFLFDPIWTLSGSQQGKYLHKDILNDAIIKLKEGKLKPHVRCVVAINQVCDELIKLGSQSLGRVVMTTDVTQLG